MAFNAWNIFMCHNSELAQSIYRVAQRHVFAYVHRRRRRYRRYV